MSGWQILAAGLLVGIVVSLLTKPPEGAAEELDEIAAKY